MKLYLAGPMRGRPQFNFPAFDAAAVEVRAMGHQVLNPAERDIAEGFEPDGTVGDIDELEAQGFDLEAAMAHDFGWIATQVDGVVLLSEWETSSGARAEALVANKCGKGLYRIVSGDLVRLHAAIETRVLDAE